VIAAIEQLMVHDTAGDPITGLKWTHKTTAKISRELRCARIDISPNTVARLLKGLGYSLRVNHKKIAGKSHPCRDQQFRQISKTRRAFRRDGLPILSVDTKKKELIGQFKNSGVAWQKTPILVKDHDFRSEGIGMAVPYGVLDIEANRGRIFVGTSHDTPAFAVHALAQWWKGEGRRRYPGADHLLVLADSGGSNGARTRAWKHELQTMLCNPFEVAVTVCHYPPGASKWNPIEHRLFSEVSKSWAGHPLLSHETMIKYIRTTTTEAGLAVGATLVDRDFPTGQKVTDGQMQRLNLVHHRTLPVWNYTILPAQSAEV
jgi:hypothetical protein